jgi:myo-inositol-1(or 4)-monophosphatase
MEQNINEYKRFVKLLILSSEKVIKHYFRQPLSIETKQDATPVTIADKKAEELMRELIMKEFPHDGIIGEEFGMHKPHADYIWVLDPIDGTKSFVCGAVNFGTLVGLLYKGIPILGALNLPVLNELLIGDNQITLLNDKVTQLRTCRDIGIATLLITDPYSLSAANYRPFKKLLKQVRMYRFLGDCYGYYLVASGFADIMIDPVVAKWDVLPLIPIIRGAKGIITDLQGKDASKVSSVIATTKEIHSKLVSILN